MAKKISFVAPIVMMSIGLFSMITGIIGNSTSDAGLKKNGTLSKPAGNLANGVQYKINAKSDNYYNISLSATRSYKITDNATYETEYRIIKESTWVTNIYVNKVFKVDTTASYILEILNRSKNPVSFKIAVV